MTKRKPQGPIDLGKERRRRTTLPERERLQLVMEQVGDTVSIMVGDEADGVALSLAPDLADDVADEIKRAAARARAAARRGGGR